jgi:hypothetical protein
LCDDTLEHVASRKIQMSGLKVRCSSSSCLLVRAGCSHVGFSRGISWSALFFFSVPFFPLEMIRQWLYVVTTLAGHPSAAKTARLCLYFMVKD